MSNSVDCTDSKVWDYLEFLPNPFDDATGTSGLRAHTEWNFKNKVTYVDVSPVFAQAIKSIHMDESISSLFV